MALSEEFLAELKARNDIESVVSSYVTLTKGGRNPKGLCPFHNEKTPSFTLYPENGSFYCFGCGTGGDVIRFIRLIENLDYIDAVRLLADRCGMQMPVDGADDTAAKLKQTVLAINRETARYYHTVLKSEQGKTALAYFRRRGLTDETIVHFGLGYSPEGWNGLRDHLRQKNFSYEQMAAAGVVSKGKNDSYYDRFRGRAMFPILDVRGNVIGFGGRRMGEEGAKYINTADTPVFKKSHNVYALNFAKSHGDQRLLLCEGYMDVIALHQAGFANAVAPLGTAFTQEQAMLLSRYTKEVVLTLDADAAGQKATDRALAMLRQAGLAARVIRIPNGKDPDEFMKNNGADGPSRFRALLEGAANEVEYRLLRAGEGIDRSTDAGRVAYLEKAAEVIGTLPSAVQRDVYAGRVAEECGVAKQAVLDTARRLGERARKQQNRRELRAVTAPVRQNPVNPESVYHRRAANAEAGLLAVLMKNPDFIAKLAPDLSADAFVTAFHRKVFSELEQRHNRGQPFDLTLLGEAFTGDELGEVVRIQTLGRDRSNTLEECQMCLRIMQEERLKDAIRHRENDSDEQAIQTIRELAQNKGV